MMDYNLVSNSLIIGIFGALLGVFYRNIMKPENMIFSWWFDILDKWVKNSRKGLNVSAWKSVDITDAYEVVAKYQKPSLFQKFLGWIAYPLGYCIYCTSTWITIILYLVILNIDIWILLSIGVQHFIVMLICQKLISSNKDLEFKR